MTSAGKIYYGMHFYPGVAEYAEEGAAPFRIFINESTIRRMSPSFAGRPIYVEHVDEVSQKDGDLVDTEADGYVIESFFNAADGKTWAKFIVVSKNGEAAIKKGFRLSNAYVPKQFGDAGTWNGMDYAKEIIDGEFEHLAIVPNPRYEESVIMTPEQFKKYNSDKELELKRLANSKAETKETTKMAFNLFKREKVENSKDMQGMIIELPKSKKEIALETLVTNADEMEMKKGEKQVANGEHMVNVDGKDMSLNELLALHKANSEELAKMKSNAGGEGEKADIASMDNEDESMDNEEDEAKKKAAELVEEKKDNEEDEEKKKNEEDEKKKNASDKKKHFDTLKNAPGTVSDQVAVVELPSDQLARGRQRYGS